MLQFICHFHDIHAIIDKYSFDLNHSLFSVFDRSIETSILYSFFLSSPLSIHLFNHHGFIIGYICLSCPLNGCVHYRPSQTIFRSVDLPLFSLSTMVSHVTLPWSVYPPLCLVFHCSTLPWTNRWIFRFSKWDRMRPIGCPQLLIDLSRTIWAEPFHGANSSGRVHKGISSLTLHCSTKAEIRERQNCWKSILHILQQ